MNRLRVDLWGSRKREAKRYDRQATCLDDGVAGATDRTQSAEALQPFEGVILGLLW